MSSQNTEAYDRFTEQRARLAYDSMVRCEGCGQMRPASVMRRVARSRVCEPCLNNHEGPPVGTYPRGA